MSEESKQNEKELYTFSVGQKKSLAQQISLLEITVRNTMSKIVYSENFTRTSIKKQGFPSNELNTVEAFIKSACKKEEGLSVSFDETPKKGGKGIMEVSIKKDDRFFPMLIKLQLNEVKRKETDVLKLSLKLPHATTLPSPNTFSLCLLTLTGR